MYISNTDVNSVDAAAFLAAMRYQTIRVNRIGYSQTFRFQTMAVTHYSGYAALSVTFLDMVGTPLTPVHGADYSIAFTGNPGPTGPTGPTGPALGWPALAPDGSDAEPSYSFASVPNSGLYRDAEGLLLKAGGGGGSGAVRIIPQAVNHGVRLQVRDHSQPGGPEWVDRIFINEASVALAGGATGVGLAAPGAALGAPVTRLSVRAGNNLGYNALVANDDNGLNPQVLWNNGNLPVAQGDWTPTLMGTTGNPAVTYSQRVGKWARIGPLVMLTMRIETTSVSGGGGSIRIEGLPFAPASGMATNGFAHGSADFNNLSLPDTVYSLGLRLISGAIGLVQSRYGIGASFTTWPAWPNNGGISHGSIIYFTDDP